MKQQIFFEIIQKLKSNPALMKKVKIFAIIGLIGFVFTGGLAIWAGISAFKYIVNSANQAVTSPVLQSHIQEAKAELKQLNIQQMQIQPVSCWSKAQSLMALQPWLDRSLLDNFLSLKSACLDLNTTVCDGYDCTQMKKNMYTVKGDKI